MRTEPRETQRVNRFKLTPEACTDGLFKGYIGIDRINSAATKGTTDRFTHLMHHLGEFNLRQAYRKLDGAKASGIDQITKEEYGCLEDKIVQNLCAKILEAIYEPIFHRHSFGFRPGKDAHQAIARLHQEIRLRKDDCTVILDQWFQDNWAVKGQMVRYADDAVFVFNNEQDATEFQKALNERLANEGGLKLNADKSGLTRFSERKPEGNIPFLGFIFYWGRTVTLKRILKVKTDPKKVAASIQRFKEWIKANRHQHRLAKLWELVATRLRGHYNYYGVTSNEAKMNHYYYACIRELFKWLNRRSQKRSYNWEGFLQRLRFDPLPKPPHGKALIDITNGLGSKLKHKLKSRVREIRKHGSERSRGWQHPLFT